MQVALAGVGHEGCKHGWRGTDHSERIELVQHDREIENRILRSMRKRIVLCPVIVRLRFLQKKAEEETGDRTQVRRIFGRDQEVGAWMLVYLRKPDALF